MTNHTQVPSGFTQQPQLITVFNGQIGGRTAQVCDGRDLHGFLEVGRNFTNWMKGRINEYGFVQDEDYVQISRSPNPARGNRGARTDYHLGLDMAKELAMVENNTKGREARRYFISCERQALAAATTREPLPGFGGSGAMPHTAAAPLLEPDPWELCLREYLGQRLSATPTGARRALFVPMTDLLIALGLAPTDTVRGNRMVIGRIVVGLGWRHTQIRVPGKRVTGYRPGRLALETGPVSAALPKPAPASALIQHPSDRTDPLDADVRRAIHRKAHALSLDAFEHNIAILEDFLRRDGDLSDPDAAIARIHALEFDHGKTAMVDLHLLHAITSRAAAAHLCLEQQQQAINQLHAALGWAPSHRDA